MQTKLISASWEAGPHFFTPCTYPRGKLEVRRNLKVGAQPPDSEGAKVLLERDRWSVKLPETDPFDDEGPPSKSKAPAAPAAGRQAARARSQLIETEASTSQAVKDGPRTAGQAIAEGIETLQKGDPQQAIGLFQTALELPGRGAFRLQGSAKEYSCASEGEEMAALYNLACAYTALGKKEAALASLEGAIATGFDNWEVLRSDDDLRPLQGPELERLIKRDRGPSFLARLNPFGKRQ